MDKDALTAAIEDIQRAARKFGLDGFPMRYEICPADIIYTFGAYGMPVRFSHWSFGKAFHRMKTRYDFNLSRIYELVINADPCHAFLLDSNSLLQNKVIVAHVLAHSDFFKHNYRFAATSRTMPETMAVHASRLRRYERRYGRDEVEALLDAALALQEQTDPYLPPPRRDGFLEGGGDGEAGADQSPARAATPYDDLWSLDGKEKEAATVPAPEDPRDLLLYIIEHGRHLADWQKDVLGIIRTEMLYFWPQLETKILNEGWATYWHARLLRRLDLSEGEAVEFARMHGDVLAPHPLHVNPYRLGYELLRSIEARWMKNPGPLPEDRRDPEEAAREKLFEVRETETDLSLVRNYLTEELVEELDLYVYRRRRDEWVVVDKNWEAVRDELTRQLTHGGVPVITVADGDYRKNGELMLRHRYEGVELDLRHLERTLPYVYTLWGRPVHLETVVDGRRERFSCTGGAVVRQ